MGVDEARRDDAPRRVQAADTRVGSDDVGARADGHDQAAGDSDRAVEDDPPLGVHRDDVAAGHEEIGRGVKRGRHVSRSPRRV